jgi:hypothetical protein
LNQVKDKHHATTHGDVMKFRMQNMCHELVGILPEEEWYTNYVLTGEMARGAVCDRKGQMCDRYPTQQFIDDFVPVEKLGGLFTGAGAKKGKRNLAAPAATQEAGEVNEAKLTKKGKGKRKRKGKDEL